MSLHHEYGKLHLHRVDWADQVHAYHMICPGNKPVVGEFKQAPEAIDNLIQEWRKRFPGRSFVVAIETTKGPLINALAKYEEVIIYLINPTALASFRKAFAHGGGKNDRSDAMLLTDYLLHFRNKLKPLRRDDSITRELAALTEDRRRLVDQRTAACNKLQAVLKRYFPTILGLEAAKIYADFILHLIIKYPTLAEAQQAGKARLRKLFFGLGTKAKIAKRTLAYKWQRIIFRCWQSRTPYDDQRYMERLKATGSPLLAWIPESDAAGRVRCRARSGGSAVAERTGARTLPRPPARFFFIPTPRSLFLWGFDMTSPAGTVPFEEGHKDVKTTMIYTHVMKKSQLT